MIAQMWHMLHKLILNLSALQINEFKHFCIRNSLKNADIRLDSARLAPVLLVNLLLHGD
jgi:hypothetical protein